MVAGELNGTRSWSSLHAMHTGSRSHRGVRSPTVVQAMAMLVGILLLAGCSANTTSSSTSATRSTSGPTTTTRSLPGVTTIPYSPAKNARRDVTTSGPCRMTGTSWEFAGSVTNSSSSARSYQIVVDFVTQPGDTVLDTTIVTTASVRPGGSLPWTTTGAAGQKDVACVIRQVQAPA